MARANRLTGVGSPGGVFHLTHRCHNRAFLLRFARDRDASRALIREHLKREPCWTEGLAVGSQGFLEKVKSLILSRRETEIVG